MTVDCIQQDLPHRSASLDPSFLSNTPHSKKTITLIKTDPSLFPTSGYDSSDEDTEEIFKPIYRSYTVGSKHAPSIFYHTRKFLQDNHDTYPDMSNASKKPPHLQVRIDAQLGDIHDMSICNSLIIVGTCLNGLRMFDIGDEENNSCSLEKPHADTIRSTCFPHDHKTVWAGTENGCILSFDTQTGKVLSKRTTAYTNPITFILRKGHTEFWVLDQEGNLEMTTSKSSPECASVVSNARTAILTAQFLWLSPGDFVYRFDPKNHSQSTVLAKDILQLFTIEHCSGQVFGIQCDGGIMCWDEHTLEQKQMLKIASEPCSSAVVVGTHYLWVGFCSGVIAIYDTRPEPWVAVKVWKAHSNAVIKLTLDQFSVSETLPVVSMDLGGNIAVWDGLLGQHWMEGQLLSKTNEYCEFNDLTVMACSWNMDAVKPDALSDSDVEKLQDWLQGMDDPDIIHIGTQEIADLSSTALTAKSILTLNKKIETIEKADELLTHRYMLWYNYFTQVINKNFGVDTYKMVKTDQLIGLFSCVFVKQSLTPRIKQCDSSVVKTGFRVMNKSLHGNKGGIAIRLVIDDSSICFINCHLAAGQKNVVARSMDIEGILYSARFPTYDQSFTFKRDADGSSVLDHETCFLGGDLNYRIDLERDQVMQLLEQGENKLEAWETLQYKDQLKNEQQSNPLFRVIGFKEAPILFDPTYKYDRGTDVHDTSEKKRVPAWCDRILYRAPNTTSNLYYKRYEVQASDHRPIGAGFSIQTKVIDSSKLETVHAAVKLEWQDVVKKHLQKSKTSHVVYYGLCDENEAIQRLSSADWEVDKVVDDLRRDKGYCSC